MLTQTILKNPTKSLFLKLLFALALSMIFLAPSAYARECSSPSDDPELQSLGERLVTNFWNDVVEQDVEKYSRKIACTFQGLNLQGIYNRDDQIEGLEGLTVTSFTLENVFTARHANTLVISYDFNAEGEGIVSGPSIDVWSKTQHGWKLISHSYVPFDT